MIVIVEGIDRVGKSTLTTKLQDKGFKILNGKLKCNDNNIRQVVETDRICAQLDLLEMIDNEYNIVIDRFHLSQLVYGLINRKMFDKTMLEVDLRLSLLNCELIFVNPKNIDKSCEEHGDDLKIHQALFDMLKCITKIRYRECTYDDIDDLVEKYYGNNCKYS